MRDPARLARGPQIHSRVHRSRPGYAAGDTTDLLPGVALDAYHRADRRHHLPDQIGRGVRQALCGWAQGMVLRLRRRWGVRTSFLAANRAEALECARIPLLLVG